MTHAHPLTITVLVDNTPAPRLENEWGLSLHIAAQSSAVLLDFGQTDAFARNAEALGINLADVDHAVLSHAHYDHSDGMEAFFDANSHAPLHISDACGEDCWSTKGGTTDPHYIGIRAGLLERYARRLERHAPTKVVSFAPGMFLVPHGHKAHDCADATEGMYRKRDGRFLPDTFAHELTLVCEQADSDGVILLSSCSHAGVTSILQEAAHAFPERPITAFIGGLHLMHADDATIRDVARAFAEHDVRQVWCGHCTGDRASSLLPACLPDRVHTLYSGLRITF